MAVRIEILFPPPTGTFQYGTDPFMEQRHAERLRHIVVGAAVEPTHFILLQVTGRQENNRHIPQPFHLAAEGKAVAVRQVHIHQHQIRFLQPECFQSQHSCQRGGHLIALLPQIIYKTVIQAFVIFHNEYLFHKSIVTFHHIIIPAIIHDLPTFLNTEQQKSCRLLFTVG